MAHMAFTSLFHGCCAKNQVTYVAQKQQGRHWDWSFTNVIQLIYSNQGKEKMSFPWPIKWCYLAHVTFPALSTIYFSKVNLKNVNSPNIQMSLAIVNLLKLIDSGAIHLIGSLPFEAKTRKEETII